MLHLKHNIKLIRGLSGKKQEDFIKLFQGVTIAMQKSYEGGKAKPDIVYMQQLAEYSGVTQHELLNKELLIEDIEIQDQVEKAETGKKKLTDRDLYAMFLTVSAAQTQILESIKKDMARQDSQTIINETVNRIETSLTETLTGVEFVSGRQLQKIIASLAELKAQKKDPSPGVHKKSDESDEDGHRSGIKS